MKTSSQKKLLNNCRRELAWMLAGWFLVACWVIGYCWLFGYAGEDQTPSTTLGFPSWVVWGVVAPWLVSAALTCWFAFGKMSDDDLDTPDE